MLPWQEPWPHQCACPVQVPAFPALPRDEWRSQASGVGSRLRTSGLQLVYDASSIQARMDARSTGPKWHPPLGH